MPHMTTTPSTPKTSPKARAQRLRYIQYAVFAVVVISLVAITDWAVIRQSFLNPTVLAQGDYAALAGALGKTLIYTFLGFLSALVTGLILALMRLSSVGPYRWFATAYIEFFRGIPALLVFFAVGLGTSLAFGLNFNIYLTAVIALGLVGSAYIAETMRAGIQAVPTGQIEASRSLGLSHTQTMIKVVIPQATRIILPPLTNEFILLTKDSSLIYVVGLSMDQYELAQFGKQWMNTEANMTPLLIVGLCYLIVTVPLGQLVHYLERKTAKAKR